MVVGGGGVCVGGVAAEESGFRYWVRRGRLVHMDEKELKS